MGLNQRLVTDLRFQAGGPPPLLAPLINVIASPTAIPSIALGPIPPGATVIVQHGLHEDGLGAVTPSIVFPDRASPLIVLSADKFTITIFNPGDDLGDDQEVLFRAERKHTIEENPNLLVQMLWKGLGSGGVPDPDVQEFTTSGCVLPGVTTVRLFPVDEELQIYLAPVASGPDGRTVSIRLIDSTLNAIILPNNLAEGVNGPPGSTYTLTPEEPAVTFEADIANATWWKV